jgi:hypothetical protein
MRFATVFPRAHDDLPVDDRGLGHEEIHRRLSRRTVRVRRQIDTIPTKHDIRNEGKATTVATAPGRLGMWRSAPNHSVALVR